MLSRPGALRGYGWKRPFEIDFALQQAIRWVREPPKREGLYRADIDEAGI